MANNQKEYINGWVIPTRVEVVNPDGSVTGTTPVAASDDMANPTAPQVINHNMIWDSAGGNWDRRIGAAGKAAVAPLNAASLADGVTITTAGSWDSGGAARLMANGPLLFGGGTTWDRQRNNSELTLIASGARTATNNSGDQINYNGKRLLLTVDVSTAGTGSITPSLQVKDPVSGNYFTIWTAAAAIVTVTTVAYYFADGASGGLFTEKLAFGLPSRTWRLVMTHNNANSITYSAGGVITL